MNHVYKVPIIPQNLNKHETIIQVAELLSHLSNVTDDMLKHINNRVEFSSNKLLDISERVTKVRTKITKLSGAKKATQVFSSCKYPATDINQPYTSVFSDVKCVELIRRKVIYKKVPTNDEPVDKLHIYHVKVNNNNNKEPANGLGEVPNDIECINDLLLYNSGKNLYRHFVMSDALQLAQQVQEYEVVDNASIGAAPHSISERSTLTRSSTQNYFYTPNLGEVPALDVPLDLPDLPGIADDLRYNTELGPGIAPSVTTTPNIPDLPVIEHTEPSSMQVNILPPPPSHIEEVAEVMEQGEVQLKPISNLIKLPKPPVVPAKTEDEPPILKIPEMPQIDVRASLMEAIRKAGGLKNAKLKAATVVKQEAPKLTGGDLMADLHTKLSMRRKGISGTRKQENNVDAGSTLEKISAMIPPPVINTELNETNTEDEDWDD